MPGGFMSPRGSGLKTARFGVSRGRMPPSVSGQVDWPAPSNLGAPVSSAMCAPLHREIPTRCRRRWGISQNRWPDPNEGYLAPLNHSNKIRHSIKITPTKVHRTRITKMFTASIAINHAGFKYINVLLVKIKKINIPRRACVAHQTCAVFASLLSRLNR